MSRSGHTTGSSGSSAGCFILATGTIVAVSGLWPETQPAIFALLATAGLFVLVVHDVLPAERARRNQVHRRGQRRDHVRHPPGVLTGGNESPFFFTFPLIVGGAALVVPPRVTFALAAVASLGYVFAVSSASSGPVPPAVVAQVGINLTALVLLAYVAMVIAREQRRARDAAIRLSTIDPLTGLFNRTYFFTAVDREIARSARSSRGFCLLMMDLDELKTINDRHGHYFGDRVLRGVGEVIRSGVRKIDTAARYGGDEFVVLLPETDPTGAYVLAEKVRIGVTELEHARLRATDRGVDLGWRRQLPGRRPDERRAADQRRPGDVRLEAGRQEPGHGLPGRRLAGRRTTPV